MKGLLFWHPARRAVCEANVQVKHDEKESHKLLQDMYESYGYLEDVVVSKEGVW